MLNIRWRQIISAVGVSLLLLSVIGCGSFDTSTNLTRHTAPEYHPDWSPDGTKIAFSSYRDGNSEIYVMDAK